MSKSLGKEAIVDQIRQRIRHGQYSAGDRLPSERELATQFGVSRAVVQIALDALETTGVVRRVPNHRPVVVGDSNVDQPSTKRTRNQVAVWIQPNLDDFGAASILQGIRTEIADGEFSLFIGLPPSTERSTTQRAETEFLRQIVQRPDVAGAIIWDTGSKDFDTIYSALSAAEIPVVFVDREPPESIEADVVATNHRRGAKKAVQHLISLGHRDIAIVLNDEAVSSVHDRLAGYKIALSDAGIAFRQDLVLEMALEAWENDPTGSTRFVQDLLARKEMPTAIFAVNDQIALFLINALTNCGVKIPQDLSIVGFDWLLRNLPSGGTLTTVAQPFDTIGRIAARLLVERIQGIEPKVRRHVLLEASLIPRSTTTDPRPASVIEGAWSDSNGVTNE